ncbi:hypothetical protein Daus18300_002457 [Diaporthe australafricana]|uniref:LrgB-like protein n=1 Tax=Diaporthe australafricana TaxID=127596 RepID=A0ABR3XP14_9PEZI
MVSVTKGWFVWLTSPSENVKHYYTIIVAITFFFVAQLLTCAWDQPFWAKGIDFPGQIVAMVFVWLVMCAAQELFCEPGRGLEKFYHEYIRAPTEVLNKHMSIGFTVPFMNLIDQPPVKARQIGLLTAAFLVTGVLNSIFVYAVAYHVQLASTKITCRLRRNPVLDVEAARGQTTAIAAEPPQRILLRGALWNIDRCDDAHLRGGAEEHSRLDRFRKHISDVSTLHTISGYISDSTGSKLAYNDELRGTNENGHDRRGHGASIPSTEISAPRLSLLNKVAVAACSWLSQNVFLTLSLLIMLPIGLPMSFFRQNDLYLDLGLLFTVWLSFTSAQMRTKQQTSLGHRHKKTLAAAATLLNPVLWTSLFLVCYGLAKSSIRNQPSADVVAGFTTDNTVSDLIAHHINSSATDARKWSHLGSIPIGAGDVATSILNAGIVSWGLKLFEYRHQIVSSGGFTVVITSLLASLLNVVAWPLLAHAMGVRPASSDLSFAARSVTIALGGPAMKSLGGDTGVNAVGVVVNGICFQLVAGFLAAGGGFAAAGGRCNETSIRCGWTGLVRHGKIGETRELDSLTPYSCREGGRGTQMTGSQTDHDREVRYSSDATHFGEQRLDYQNDEISWGVTHAAADIDITRSSNTGRTEPPQVHESVTPRPPSVVPTVAAGVTIGINAAAMGTAHLYEQNSQAAPYSALSMTMFGVFTVLFAVRGPMTEWIVTRVGG